MEISNISEWNPWWENKESINLLMGQHRPCYDTLVNSVSIKEITILVGVRRSGKSTLMYQMIYNLMKEGVNPQQILFVNLEDQKLISYSLEEIYLSYKENVNPDKKAYIFLDEIHKKNSWEAWIRKKYDLNSNDKFVISGSCSYLLKREYSTLLTGRNLTFEVFPLSFKEYLEFNGLKIDEENIKRGIILEKTRIQIFNHLKAYFEIGGFPEIVSKPKEFKTKILKQYFDDILYKDIIDRHNLNSQKTKDLALFLITNFTNFISLRTIRGSLGIAYDSIKDYLSCFKEAFLFFTIDHFSYSFKEQKTLPSKVYCIDNGLRNSVSFKFSKDEGKLAENISFLHLKTKENEIYYWKNEKQQEVDFVFKNKGDRLTALNISYTDDVDERELTSLLEFKKNFKKTEEIIIITKNIEKKEKGIKFIPLWKWLLN
jgi:predicted AAA+ superfamily ATPase